MKVRRTWEEARELREKIAAFMRRKDMPMKPCQVAWEFRMSNQNMHQQLRMMMKEGLVKKHLAGRYIIAAEAQKES